MSERLRAVRNAARQFSFHRDMHHGWRRIAIWLAVSQTLTAGAFTAWLTFHATAYVTVAATPDGRIIPLVSLDEPVMTDASLRNWTVSAVTEAFTLGHHDWRMRLADIRESFTDRGYESFLQSLEESRFLLRLRRDYQVASAVAQGAPVVTDVRRHGGRLVWAVEMPILVSFSAGSSVRNERLLARALVTRVSRSERAAGIGIDQLIASKGKKRS